jgi:hypothetical protein
MTTWQTVRIIAGSFILLSLALGIPGSPIYVSGWWLAAERVHAVVPDGIDPAQARPASGCMNVPTVRWRTCDEPRLPCLRHHQPRARGAPR